MKALQRFNSIIKMDNNIADLTDFIFGINNTVLLGQINLDIPIKLIIFHIMSVNIPFFLCFTNIDKLGVFLNNITNEWIRDKFIDLVVCRYSHVFLM